MTEMRKVVRLFTDEKTVTETTSKKVDAFKNGASRTETTTKTVTTVEIYAELSCGHSRIQQRHENFTETNRLSCHACDQISWTKVTGNQKHIDEFTRRAAENMAFTKAAP